MNTTSPINRRVIFLNRTLLALFVLHTSLFSARADLWERRASVPGARAAHSAVWTGREMIVWGGASEGGVELNDGGRYNPESDTWSPISNASGLEPRMEPTGIWTGEEFIVFGGMKFTGGQLSFADGARYNPATDTWTPLPG